MARDKLWLTAEQAQLLLPKLQAYLSRELDLELGRFEAQFLLEFMAQQLGPTLYNQALADAQRVLAERWAGLEDALWQREQPTRRMGATHPDQPQWALRPS